MSFTSTKYPEYADDTYLILDGSADSLYTVLDTLELYATFSGLKINSTKTKVTYIGWKKKSAEVFHQSRWKLDWRETTFFLLRIHFSVELNRMINLNDNIPLPKITKWSSILCIWFWFNFLFCEFQLLITDYFASIYLLVFSNLIII